MKPELLWSPSKGLLMKERGYWYRVLHANGVRSIAAEYVHPLPADVQMVSFEEIPRPHRRVPGAEA